MSRVLLTGGTGFLGSHVAELLVDAGHDVLATVRTTSDTRWIDPLPIETITADLEDAGGLAAALEGAEVVVHVGGVTIAADPGVYDRVNHLGTGALAGAAAEAGVERFVYVSSLAARGPDGAGGPVSPYGRSKRDGERRLAELTAAGRAPGRVTILRPGGIYGPRDPDLLSLFRMAARGLLVLPSVEGRLQPAFVRDVARAVVKSLESAAGAPSADPLPVAGRDIVTWEEVGEVMATAFGRKMRVLRVPPAAFLLAGGAAEAAGRLTRRAPVFDRRRARDLTRRTFTADIDGTSAALGWTPAVGIGEGMSQTVAWYREHGWLTS